MARPLRPEFAGALNHRLSRGERGERICDNDDEDRRTFLEILGRVVGDFNMVCHAWCLITNHYHLLVDIPDGNLAKDMRQLNGIHTQQSSRRHGRGIPVPGALQGDPRGRGCVVPAGCAGDGVMATRRRFLRRRTERPSA